jgi:Winged helix DNA-binding domain
MRVEVMDDRALNRALLARQLLLRRAKMPVGRAVEHLVGLQAQNTSPPYFALWSRLEGFRIEDLSRALRQRRVVRLALLRSTIHLVTARDCRRLRPVLAAALRRAFYTGSPFGRRLAGLDTGPLVAAGRALVEAEPLTLNDLGQRLHARWPDRDPEALGQALRNLSALVQVPPRGVWGEGGLARHTTAESWLRGPLGREDAPDALVLRYLAAFGPANARDVQTWSGVTGAQEVLERLRPRLRVLRDGRGRELFDLRRAPRPGADTPAPVRFLGEYDNLLLSHQDRTRVVDDAYRARMASKNGVLPGVVLVDGFVRAAWKLARKSPAPAAAALTIETFAPLSRSQRAEVIEEGQRLLAFATPEARRRAVRFARVT